MTPIRAPRRRQENLPGRDRLEAWSLRWLGKTGASIGSGATILGGVTGRETPMSGCGQCGDKGCPGERYRGRQSVTGFAGCGLKKL